MSEFLSFFEEEVLGRKGERPASLKQQTEALSRVPWLCSALGPTDTRLKLLPLLEEAQRRLASKDELLLCLAAQWRAVATVAVAETKTGMNASFAEASEVLTRISQNLMKLAESDERRVQDETVKSLLFLPSLLASSQSKVEFVRSALLPATALLASQRSTIFGRCAAARLLPALLPSAERSDVGTCPSKKRENAEGEGGAFGKAGVGAIPSAGEEEEENDAGASSSPLAIKREALQLLFETLCTDESLLVRRAALAELPAFVENASTQVDVAREEAGLIALRVLRNAFAESADLLRATAVTSAVGVALCFPAPQGPLCSLSYFPERSEDLPSQGNRLLLSSASGVASPFLAGPAEREGRFDVSEILALPLVAAEDPAWRVRSAAAKAILCIFRFAPSSYPALHRALGRLLEDAAVQEVRLPSLKTFAKVAEEADPETVEMLLAPQVYSLLRLHAPTVEAPDAFADSGDDTLAFFSPAYTATVSTPQLQVFEAAVDAALAVGKRAGRQTALAVTREAVEIIRRGELPAGLCGENACNDAWFRRAFLLSLARRASDFCRVALESDLESEGHLRPCKEAEDFVDSLCVLSDVRTGAGEWRLRLAVVKQTPRLADALGAEFFERKLNALYLQAFTDPVYEVREAAAYASGALVGVLKEEWASSFLLPLLASFHSQSSKTSGVSEAKDAPASGYLIRVTAQFALPKLAGALSEKLFKESVLPLLKKGLRDSVPNVRLTAAEMIRIIVFEKKVSRSVLEELKRALELVVEDPDVDARFSAQLALQTLKGALASV